MLAQVNIGRLRAPLDSPELAGFVAALDPVNAAADAAPGFVWRLQTEDGNATAVRAFEWDEAGSAGVIVNLSVWESPEALAAFVYSDAHRRVLARRRQWFERMTEAYTALWWIPRGTVPGTADAEDRVRRLRAQGPTAEAFTLRVLFPPPGGDGLPRPGGRTGPARLTRRRSFRRYRAVPGRPWLAAGRTPATSARRMNSQPVVYRRKPTAYSQPAARPV